MSSRDIEGENPLYLPQAKIFKNSCAIGPIFVTTESVDNPYNLDIYCSIIRNKEILFFQKTNTNLLKRNFEDLIFYLKSNNNIYPGTILLTGTCIVPPDEFSLINGDIIEITIDHLGTLRNEAKGI
jgi:2-dehydro-3-deoxy-D-arabinonate dehydratase